MIALPVTKRQAAVVTCARPSQRDRQINARTAAGCSAVARRRPAAVARGPWPRLRNPCCRRHLGRLSVIPLGGQVRTYYVSRVIDLPPLVAQAAYDAEASCAADGTWELAVGRARLTVGPPVRTQHGTGYQPYRSQRATVTTGLTGWPVEIELLPWSDVRVELGLGPMDSLLRRFPPDRVVNAEHALVDVLAARMRQWAEQLLAEWAADMSRCGGFV